VFGLGTVVSSGTGIMAWVVGAFSIHGVVMTGVNGAPMPCLLGEGRPEPPPPTRLHEELHSGVLNHDPLWRWCPTAS
jgi:hypothetical protein